MSDDSVIDNIFTQLLDKNEEVSLGIHDFAEKQGKFLLDELMKDENSHVQRLNINGTEFEVEGAKLLGQLVAQSKQLAKVVVHARNQRDEMMLRHLMAGIAQSTSMEVVQLTYCKMSVAVELCEMVTKSMSLRELDLTGNALQESAVTLIETVLGQKRLTRLRVGGNEIPEEATLRICAVLKSNNTCLKSVDLSGSRFTEEGKKSLEDWLRDDRVLEEVYLSACELKDEGVAMIANALHSNAVLKTIGLKGNKFGAAGGQAIAEMLLKNSCLQILDIGGNNLGVDGCKAICDGMKINRGITELSMRECELRNEDFEEMAAMLRVNSTLQTLYFSRNDEFAESLPEIAKALAGHRWLKVLEWPAMCQSVSQACRDILWEGNGSLSSCWSQFNDVCERNMQNHDRARQAVQTLRILRNGKPNVLHVLPKDVVKMIGELVWESRTELQTWKLHKQKNTKREGQGCVLL